MNKNNITYSIYNGDSMRFVIIYDGKINFKNIVKDGLSFLDIFNELNKRKIRNIESIKLLLIYKNIYFIKLVRGPISLIVEGKYVYSNSFNNNKTFFWLKKILGKYNLNIKYIKYAVINRNRLFIIKYNN